MSELETDKEQNAYSKSIKDGNEEYHYYIKAYRADKTFYDKEDSTHSHKTRVGSMMRVNDPYYWQKVNKTVFETFSGFLKTGNRSYKREAERLFQNG
jgi:hypothetical protein